MDEHPIVRSKPFQVTLVVGSALLVMVVLAAVMPSLQRGDGVAPSRLTSTPATPVTSVPATVPAGSVGSNAPSTVLPPATHAEPLPTSMVVRYQVQGFGYTATFVQPPPAPCGAIALAGHASDYNQYPVWYGEVGGQYLQVCAGEKLPPGATLEMSPAGKRFWHPTDQGLVAIRTWRTSPWHDGKLAIDVPYSDSFYLAPEAGDDLRLVSVEQNRLLRVESAELSDNFHLYLDLATRQWQSVKYEGIPFTDGPPDMVVLLADWSLNVTRQQFDQQLAKWQAHGIEDYTMSFELEGYGGSFYHLDGPAFDYGDQGDYEAEVHGGLVQSFSFSWAHIGEGHGNPYINRTTPTPEPTPDRITIVQANAIESQFARLDRMISATKPTYCRVTFDDTYGFPNSFECKRRPDEICCLSVTRLRLVEVLKQQGTNTP